MNWLLAFSKKGLSQQLTKTEVTPTLALRELRRSAGQVRVVWLRTLKVRLELVALAERLCLQKEQERLSDWKRIVSAPRAAEFTLAFTSSTMAQFMKAFIVLAFVCLTASALLANTLLFPYRFWFSAQMYCYLTWELSPRTDPEIFQKISRITF